MNRLSDCRAVVFDAVGTLIFPKPAVADVYRYAIRKHCGVDLPSAVVQQKLGTALKLRSSQIQLTTNEAAERKFWADIVQELCPNQAGYEDCFAELFEHFGKPSSWQCFPDVADCLAQLTHSADSVAPVAGDSLSTELPASRAASFQIAIASNFDSRLHSVCDGLPDLRGVSMRIISSLVGFRKPSADFYAAVAAAVGVNKDQLLMVGDDFTNDVQGACQAGLQAAWLCRSSITNEQQAAANAIGAHVITSLHQLSSLLS